MEKKQYISPLVEAMPVATQSSIMVTSTPLPPDMVRRRWTDVF